MKIPKISKELLRYCENEQEEQRLKAVLEHGSNRAAAEHLWVDRRTVDRTVNRVIERAVSEGFVLDTAPRILIFDIETAPCLSWLWSLYKPVFGHNMMESESYVLSWAAKWLGEDEVMVDGICNNPNYSSGDEDDRRMLEGIWQLLDEADFVVAHNGDKFDVKRLNTRFVLNRMVPPSSYRVIDTLKIVKRTFAFDSNRLDFLLKVFFGDSKGESGGFETWRGCINGDMEAWDQLLAYNKDDVTKLEQLYLEIRGWDRLHPSAATAGGVRSTHVCTVCNSEDVELIPGKYHHTSVSKFPLFRCNDCGATMRSRDSVITPQQRANLLVKA
jgi:hypothetical protein